MDTRAGSAVWYVRLEPVRWDVTNRYGFTGYVTHGTDRSLWMLRLPILEGDQVGIARKWVSTIAEYVKRAEEGHGISDAKVVLGLTKDKEIKEKPDELWDEYMLLRTTLPGEE